jgi:hypothetical protein
VTDLTTERPTERPDPGPPSGLCDPFGQPVEQPPVLSGGVELTRLMALARLTAPQALEIGAGVLAEAARRSEPDTGSPGSRPLGIGRVLIGDDGRVGLGPAVDGGSDGRPRGSGPTGRPLEAVLADVAAAARHRARRPDPAADDLVAVLDDAVRDLPAAGVHVIARQLQDAAAAIDRGAVRAELAALVRAIGGTAGSAGGSGPGGSPPTVGRPAPARRATREDSRRAGRRVGAWLLSIVVLAVIVLLEAALLRTRIATDIGLLMDAGGRGSAPSAAPPPDGLPLVSAAPAAAGNVTGVDLRPLAQCTPGTPCTFRVLVRLLPGARPQDVTWSYRIVDRCTGATATAPGGSVAVPAGGDRAEAVGTLALPGARAVAVVAVTGHPAVAASAPVLAGSCLPHPQAE